MKRTFADLHLQIDLGNMTMVERIIGKIAQLGFGLVGVPLPPEIRENEMAKLREICREANISLVNRVDLRPKSRGQLMNQLRKLRRKFEVICVLCENKEVARQAAKGGMASGEGLGQTALGARGFSGPRSSGPGDT